MRLKILGSCALGALALAACSQQPANPSASSDSSAMAGSSQPLAPPNPAETAPAPAASALPAAQPAPVRYAPPAQQYGELNDAAAMSQTYADAPPDYAFDYDGQAPQVWGSQDGVVRVAERVPGGWRYFYYHPGSANPYLVRDPEYAYGYDDGQLVVVYDSRGRALPPEWGDRQAWLAGRYLARGHDLWRAARERRRMEIEDQVWRDEQADQDRQRRYWDETRGADPDWRAYHDAHEAEERDRWVGIAAAWAAAQVVVAPQPRDGWSQPRDGGVGAARQAWWGRMAQGPGPAQPPVQRSGWSTPMQPAQPPSGGWNGQPPHNPGGPMQPASQGWNGHPHEGPGPAQPPAQGWNGHPHEGPGPAQPPSQGWNGHPHEGPGPAQPASQGWDGRHGDTRQPPQGHGQGQGEGQPHGQGAGQGAGHPDAPHGRPEGRPAGQGWAGAHLPPPKTEPVHPHPIAPQPPARVEPAHAVQPPHAAPPQPPAEHPHAAPPQAKPEHAGKPEDHSGKKEDKR